MGGEGSLIEIACPSVNSPCILLWHVPLVIPSDLKGLVSFVLTLLAGSTAGFPLHFRAVCALSLVQGLCDSCLAVIHFKMFCPGAFWVFLGSCWELGHEEQGLKAVLYFSRGHSMCVGAKSSSLLQQDSQNWSQDPSLCC